MTATPNLDLDHYVLGDTNADVPVNGMADGLDHAMNSSLTINFASDADYTLSTSGNVPQEWQNGTIEFTDTGPVLTTGRNVIVPNNERVYRIINNTAQTLTVKTSAGTGIAVAASGGDQLQCDGTNVIQTVYGTASDADAIHKSAASEISTLTTVTVAAGDYILIEDVSDSNNKKKILASDLLGAGTDAAAIHDDTANEITAITAKTTLDPEDEFLIEDSEASYVKKAVTYAAMMQVEENPQTGTSYTLVADDAFKIVTMTNASASTLTVPPNSSVAFPIGTQIIVTQQGAGQVTLTQGSGVTINAPDSTLTLRTQYSSVSLIKMDTNEWIAAGDLG